MDKTKIYIYGASGHGLVVADIAMACGYHEIVFLDDNGELKFNDSLDKADIIIAVGENKIRAKLQKKVLEAKFHLVNLIHPSAVISPSTTFGVGIVVMPNAIINAKAVIDDGVIINSSAVVEHECKIGKFVHISPNVALAGGVKVGEFSHIGIGSSFLQCVKIGNNCKIGAGAVVISDIKNNCVAVGVPAKVIKKED